MQHNQPTAQQQDNRCQDNGLKPLPEKLLNKPSEQARLRINFLKDMLGQRICDALNDEDVTEIMVNPDGSVWFESREQGIVCDSNLSEYHAQNFLMQLAELNGVYLTPAHPYIETLLPFHQERLEGTIAPITARAAFTIRKPAKTVFPLEDYVTNGIVTELQFNCIEQALIDRKNIVISGGPGTGKTTLANAIVNKMSQVCDASQRVLVLEDTAEIRCDMPNVLSMVTSESVSMTTLLKIAMRSRPDRILVGEVRDAAALDLLKAWNTGCPGGIATVHANSAESSVLRLLSLAQEANVPPPIDLVAETVDVLIHITRQSAHPAGRCVSSISEIAGTDGDRFQFTHLATQEICT